MCLPVSLIMSAQLQVHHTICVSVRKTGWRVQPLPVAGSSDGGRAARRMITGLEKQAGLPKGSGLGTGAWLGRTTHRRWKLVGQRGKTARNNRKCSALRPRCCTGTLGMMARRRRRRECGQMIRPSVYWLTPGVLEWEVQCCYSWMGKFHAGINRWKGRML